MDGDITISKKKIMIVISIVLGVLLLVAIGYLIVQNKKLRDDKAALESATATASITATNIPVKTPTVTTTVTASLTADQLLTNARDVANKFMAARIDRDLNEAKIYMTDHLLAKTTQDAFAGASSPSLASIEIQSATADTTVGDYTVKIKANWTLNGESSGSTIWTLGLTTQSGTILVNSFSEEQ